MRFPSLRRAYSRSRGEYPKRRQLFALLATFVTLIAVIELSGCNAYTTAAGTGPLAASASNIDFGNVSVGSSAVQTATFTNTGTASLDLLGATVSGTGFSLAAGSLPSTIPAGQSLSVQVQFAPKSAGHASGSLVLTSDTSNSAVTSNAVTSAATSNSKKKSSLRVPLQGSATQAGLTISPMSLSFSNGTVGQTSSQIVSLTNSGTANLQLQTAALSGAGFGMTGLTLPTTIAPGQKTSFSVEFTPTSVGTVSGNISFTDNAPVSPQTLALSGTAVSATAQLTANLTSMTFGNVQVGSNNSQTATFTNTGNSAVTISSVTASGTGYSASGITSGLTLGPSQSATLTVTFAPTGLGKATGNVSIASNATNSPITISLSGESMVVSLSWAGSTSTNVSGYNIYRSTTSGAYSAAMNSSPVSGTAYTDSSVSGSRTYFYVVRALASGVESTNSNEVTASIP